MCDEDDQPVGLICWRIEGGGATAEITCLAVAQPARHQGVGRALLSAAHEALRARGIGRTWLVTTNDNMTALTLYEKAGYEVMEIRRGAIDEARRTLKPSIALVGEHGIPIRDELELARDL